MLVEPDYGNNIIVGVVNYCEWFWYVSNKEYWIMDLEKLYNEFLRADYNISSDYSDRFNIPVLNENTSKDFLSFMEPYLVYRSELSNLILERFPFSSWDEIVDLCPSLLIDFDQKRLVSLFPELTSFENYVPHGWLGEFRDFLNDVPEDQRYWIIEGRDYFEGVIRK